MRAVINGSGLFVILTIIVLIHTSIINKSVRDIEVNCGLESSMDYALDIMRDEYMAMDYEEGKEAEYTERLLHTFCFNLETAISTDGELEISIIKADIATGTFEIVVEESYTYSFKGRIGTATCERAVVFGQ